MRTLARLVVLFAAVAAVASPAAGQTRGTDTDKFLSRESALWGAVKNRQTDALRRVFADGYVAVYDQGVVGKSDELAGISQSTLRSVRLDDVKVHRLDDANVIVTYKAMVDGDHDGKSVAGTYNTMTLWHRRGNSWDVAAHSEVKAP
jgi:hypothetical protein